MIGVGQIVTERGWGGLQCMATAPGHRRRGVARAVLHAVAEEALHRAVGHLYLAVMADNEAAVALCESVGFRTGHEYSYFGNAHMALRVAQAPQEPPAGSSVPAGACIGFRTES